MSFGQTDEVFRTDEFLNFPKKFKTYKISYFYIIVQIFREVKVIEILEVLHFMKYVSLI